MTTEELRQKLRVVPAPIQDWFWSEELIDRVIALKDKFKLYGRRWDVVSELLARLEIKELSWENFKAELVKQLGVTPLEGEKIYDEIKLQLLMPIARDLAAYGIGTKEFAVIGSAAAASAPAAPPLPRTTAPVVPPAAGAAGPLPVSTTLPSFFSAPPANKPAPFMQSAAPKPTAPSVMPPAPSPVQPVAQTPVMPMPVFLHQEAQTSVAQPTFNMPLDLSNRKGNQLANAGASAAPPPRPARVELGRQLPQQDGAGPVPVRTQKETPLPRAVDYSAALPAVNDEIAIATPDISPSGDISFGMHGASNLPPMETVEIPVPTAPLPPVMAEESRGIVDSLMRKIAPWHYARFTGGGKASEVLEAPEASKIVNYTDTATKRPTPSPSADMPMPTPVPLTSQTTDIPAPPSPSA